MSKPYFSKRVLLTALVVLALPVASFGATESVTATDSPSAVTSNSGAFTFTDIPDFNPSLGTLTAVEITLTFDYQPYLSVINVSNTPEAFTNATATTSASVSLTYPTGTLTVNSPLTVAGPFSGTAPANSTTPTKYAGALGSTSQSVFGSPLASYEGTGTYDLSGLFTENGGTYQGTLTSGDAGSNLTFFGGEDDLQNALLVEYFYSAVPEPSTWALMIVSLAALVFGRRFVTRRASLS